MSWSSEQFNGTFLVSSLNRKRLLEIELSSFFLDSLILTCILVEAIEYAKLPN